MDRDEQALGSGQLVPEASVRAELGETRLFQTSGSKVSLFLMKYPSLKAGRR